MGGFVKLTQAVTDNPIWVRLDAVQYIRKQSGGSILLIDGQEVEVTEAPRLIMGGQNNAETEPGRKRVVLRGKMHTRRLQGRNGERHQTGRGNLLLDVADLGRP